MYEIIWLKKILSVQVDISGSRNAQSEIRREEMVPALQEQAGCLLCLLEG